jgi:mono/diheme cytochrome c family protein
MTLAVVLPITALPAAQADRDVFDVTSPLYCEECGSCHVAYPPGLLPKASWQAIMTGLHKHFGTDATLDPQAAKEVQAYLESHAGRRRARGKPPLRITETPWFRDEHDEVPASTWKSPAVKSAANCGACHTRADDGDYSEGTLRVAR